MIEREPPVPLPKRTRSLSPCSSVMLLERHAKLGGQHLRERRGVALAVIQRAGDQLSPMPSGSNTILPSSPLGGAVTSR